MRRIWSLRNASRAFYAYCRCPPGHRLGAGGCHPVDECVHAPCLHGSSCLTPPRVIPITSNLRQHRDNKKIRRHSRRSATKSGVGGFVNDTTEAVSSTTTMGTPLSWTEVLDGQIGYRCVCGPGYSGRYCQWTEPESDAAYLATPELLLVLLMTLAFCSEYR